MPERRLTAISRLLAAVVVAAACTGCGSSPTPAEPDGFVAQAQQVRDEAAAGGADEAQLAVLDQAIGEGVLTMEMLLDARDRYATCLGGVGAELQDQGVADRGGFQYPDYVIVMDDDGPESDALVDECGRAHFDWVDMLYQTQPTSVAAAEQGFVERMPDLIACLNRAGLPVADDVTADELKQIMLDQLRDSHPEPGDSDVTENADGSLSLDEPRPEMEIVPSCLAEVGLNGF